MSDSEESEAESEVEEIVPLKVGEIRDVFRDVSGSNTVNFAQLRSVLEMLGTGPVNDTTLRDIFDMLDEGNSGEVAWNTLFYAFNTGQKTFKGLPLIDMIGGLLVEFHASERGRKRRHNQTTMVAQDFQIMFEQSKGAMLSPTSAVKRPLQSSSSMRKGSQERRQHQRGFTRKRKESPVPKDSPSESDDDDSDSDDDDHDDNYDDDEEAYIDEDCVDYDDYVTEEEYSDDDDDDDEEKKEADSSPKITLTLPSGQKSGRVTPRRRSKVAQLIVDPNTKAQLTKQEKLLKRIYTEIHNLDYQFAHKREYFTKFADGVSNLQKLKKTQQYTLDASLSRLKSDIFDMVETCSTLASDRVATELKTSMNEMKYEFAAAAQYMNEMTDLKDFLANINHKLCKYMRGEHFEWDDEYARQFFDDEFIGARKTHGKGKELDLQSENEKLQRSVDSLKRELNDRETMADGLSSMQVDMRKLNNTVNEDVVSRVNRLEQILMGLSVSGDNNNISIHLNPQNSVDSPASQQSLHRMPSNASNTSATGNALSPRGISPIPPVSTAANPTITPQQLLISRDEQIKKQKYELDELQRLLDENQKKLTTEKDLLKQETFKFARAQMEVKKKEALVHTLRFELKKILGANIRREAQLTSAKVAGLAVLRNGESATRKKEGDTIGMGDNEQKSSPENASMASTQLELMTPDLDDYTANVMTDTENLRRELADRFDEQQLEQLKDCYNVSNAELPDFLRNPTVEDIELERKLGFGYLELLKLYRANSRLKIDCRAYQNKIQTMQQIIDTQASILYAIPSQPSKAKLAKWRIDDQLTTKRRELDKLNLRMTTTKMELKMTEKYRMELFFESRKKGAQMSTKLNVSKREFDKDRKRFMALINGEKASLETQKEETTQLETELKSKKEEMEMRLAEVKLLQSKWDAKVEKSIESIGESIIATRTEERLSKHREKMMEVARVEVESNLMRQHNVQMTEERSNNERLRNEREYYRGRWEETDTQLREIRAKLESKSIAISTPTV